jgi:hypothetical protein
MVNPSEAIECQIHVTTMHPIGNMYTKTLSTEFHDHLVILGKLCPKVVSVP